MLMCRPLCVGVAALAGCERRICAYLRLFALICAYLCLFVLICANMRRLEGVWREVGPNMLFAVYLTDICLLLDK